jgi:pimeloyl-ACP methyl ester carboxylesterase
VSTPTSLDLPDEVRRTTIQTSRGAFAALEAEPASGVCEREAALLVPGYTGSKEDFLAVLVLLADGGRRVFAIDMRGQFETPAAPDDDGYSASALGSDVTALLRATGARHLLGHSYGGLIAREAVLATAGGELASVTLMSTGPAALQAGISDIWQSYLEPQAVADGVPGPVVAFLAKRMLSNDPNGLVLMARHLLTAEDRTAELARLRDLEILVIYGEDDNSWSPDAQEAMATRLGARRVCIPGAVHSPAVEAPATTAATLTQFWNAAET